MINLDTILSQLRAGGFLLLQDKSETWLLASTRHVQNIESVLEKNLSVGEAFIMTENMNQLYDYVMRFSDLAWDIAEGSEKALLIWYDQAKALPQAFKDEEGNVGVMISRCKTLQPLLQKLGNGVYCIRLAEGGEGWQALPNVLPLPQEANCRLTPERIMRLSAQGDVKFLKY